MSATKIEWTDATWNPTTGCDRISPGCDKVRHPTRAQAQAHIAALIRRGAAAGAYEPYRCPARRGGCGGWHVGHATHRTRQEGNHHR